MSRWRRERWCKAWRPHRAIAPIAPAPAHEADRATGQGQSTPRCQRTPLPLAASGLIVDAIVIDGRTLWLAVPDTNRACGPRLKHNLADSFADQLRDAAPRPRGGLAQG